ncbi:MAG: carboxypeptidase regulatory-like domain-containing protein [Terracidiphilus sp.]
MKRIEALIVAFFCLAALAAGQSIRATLTGGVTDPTGAILPHARILITNTETGAETAVLSNSAGVYTAPFLAPGKYQVSVTLPGFKKYLHTGLVLQTEQTVTENILLQLGSASETVTVTAGTPLIDLATANSGQSLSAEQAEELPSNGRSPMGLAHLLYGVVAKGKHSMVQTRPFDNSAASDFSLGGGASESNEVLLNGVPNMEDAARVSAYSPELDAVQAVHVDEFNANADQGDTSGGVVDITTKSGTNQFHGTASEYYGGSRPFTAEPFFNPVGKAVPSVHFNQYAATMGGPVWIPHVINGHNKLFFFYAFEGYKGNSPATTIASVPTAAEREGDFSALLGLGSNYQLYNPYGATESSSGVITRNPIPNNCLTNTSSNCSTVANAGLTLDPVAQAYMKLIPMPNYDGASTNVTDGENNFYAADPTSNDYYSNEARVDYTVSNTNKSFFEFHRSHYNEGSGNVFGNALTGSTSVTNFLGGEASDVESFSPTMTLDTRLGFERTEEYGGPNSLGQNPTSLGFPGYIASNSRALALPYITFSDGASIPSLSGKTNTQEYYDDIQLFTELTKVWGRHTVKVGTDWRAQKESQLSSAVANGEFDFHSSNNDFVTASNGSNGVSQPFGGAFALFDLGLPTAGSYDIESKFQFNNWYFAEFAQDDWKMLPNLTVSYGVRLVHETPVTESNNQMANGWIPTAVNGATAAAAAAYAAIPNKPPLAPQAISPTGGVTYATPSDRTAYSTAALDVSPRIGFAYAPGFGHRKLAIRGGIGVYVNPFSDYDFGQSYGYSQTTGMTISNNSHLTPATTLSDPFPTAAPIVPPLGSALGYNTQLGNGVEYYDPGDKVPYSEKWTFDIQKQFGKTWLLEVGYMGKHEVHDAYNNDLSAVPLLPLLAQSEFPDATLTAELNKPVTNPFKGLLPGTAAVPNTTGYQTGSTLSVASLLQAYPEYTGVTERLIPAADQNFNAFLLRFGTQMEHGLAFNFNYEYARQLGAAGPQLNPGGPLWYGETTSDFPNHGSLMLTYQLPFGKGRTFSTSSRALDEIFGGYTVTSIYQFLSGTANSWGNVNYTGNFHDFDSHPHDYLTPSFNTSVFDTASKDQPNSYNYRTFPQYLLRSDPTNDVDLSLLKNFALAERVVLQPRFDAFNAFNRPQFSGPNLSPTSSSFGKISKQLNTGRELQLGVHILF